MPKAVDPDAWLYEGIPRGAPRMEAVPRSFVAFCSWVGVTLEPGQRVVAKVAYDGVQPRELVGRERELARAFFGDIEEFGPAERDVVVLVCGARAGKTYALVSLRILHLALTVPLDGLAPGEVASAPIIAPDKDLATQALNYVQGACQHPNLRPRVVGNADASEWIDLQREEGRVVEIVVRAASARGRTGRGRSLVAAAMDEAAFFHDAKYKVNDDEVFKSLSPRVLPGGQLLIPSTPWAQAGLLFELFTTNHPNPECAGLPPRAQRARTAMAIHAPSLMLREAEQLRVVVERETKRDPENAAREFGARFMSANAQTFFDAAGIEACLDLELRQLPPPSFGTEVVAGGDMGFTKNSSALCIGHVRVEDAVTVVAEMLERRPSPGQPLRPGVVSKEFLDRVEAHRGGAILVDGHYIETVREHAAPKGLAVWSPEASFTDECIAVRARMREGRYRLPNEPRLMKQLREVVGIAHAGGGMTIRLPLWPTGEHGDLVVAFVHMAFQRSGVAVPAPPATREEQIRADTEAHFEREAAEIAERRRSAWEDEWT